MAREDPEAQPGLRGQSDEPAIPARSAPSPVNSEDTPVATNHASEQSLGLGMLDHSLAVDGERPVTTPDGRVFFHAVSQPDGTYGVTLTEAGIRKFETALAIADDLGGQTRISRHSTVADIMDRTATREELSRLLRDNRSGLIHALSVSVLRRKLRGSTKPTIYQRAVGHMGKAIIVAIIGLWTVLQFLTAVQDIAAIPGILANVPSDILHLHPTSAITDVGNRIADAGNHALLGLVGTLLTYILAKLIQPLGRIYRTDQVLPGERRVLKILGAGLRRLQRRQARA